MIAAKNLKLSFAKISHNFKVINGGFPPIKLTDTGKGNSHYFELSSIIYRIEMAFFVNTISPVDSIGEHCVQVRL